MAHNQEMLEHHSERWGDKLRVIGISVDKSPEPVVKHVKAKKWEKVEHFLQAGSSCSEDYSVQGVPRVVLVDSEGNIAYNGHPTAINLEENIETLLKGGKLGEAQEGEDQKDQGEGP